MIDQLEDVAKEQHLAHIQKVTVDLGEVSGIVTDFFGGCLDVGGEQEQAYGGRGT